MALFVQNGAVNSLESSPFDRRCYHESRAKAVLFSDQTPASVSEEVSFWHDLREARKRPEMGKKLPLNRYNTRDPERSRLHIGSLVVCCMFEGTKRFTRIEKGRFLKPRVM